MSATHRDRLESFARTCVLLLGTIGLIALGNLSADSCRAQVPASQPGAGPALEPINPVHDFGKIVEGTKVTHRFTFRNAGTMPLDIIRVAPACGCMTVGEYTKSVGVGQTGGVTITLDTSRLLGAFMKTVNVVTNDPTTEIHTFTVRGDGRRLVEVSPTVAAFGRIVADKTREVILTVTNRWERPMTISIGDMRRAAPFQAELLETIPGFEYKLCVVLRPPFKEGTLTGPIELITNVPGQEKFTVTVSAVALPRLETLPNALYYGGVASEANAKSGDKVFEFLNHGSKPVAVKDVKSDDPAITIDRKDVEPGFLYRFQVRTPKDYRPPNDGKMITLTTDDSERPKIEVPVRLVGATKAPSFVAPASAVKPATTQKAEVKPVMELVGKPAPQVALTTGMGMPVSNSEFTRYPATVLNFVAPNCPHCKKQIPWVEKVRADYQERGVRFVNVGETMGNKSFTYDEAMVVMNQVGSRLELAMDAGNVNGVRYKITSFPAMVIVGKDGSVAEALPGARETNSDKLRNTLDVLLAKEMGGK